MIVTYDYSGQSANPGSIEPEYKSLRIGDCLIVEREGEALAAVRWAARKGLKFSRRKMDDGRYMVTRVA